MQIARVRHLDLVLRSGRSARAALRRDHAPVRRLSGSGALQGATVPDPGLVPRPAGRRVPGAKARWLAGCSTAHAWDLAFITFGEPHGAGHYLWHLGDRVYPTHPPGAAPAPSRPAGRLRAVDEALAVILAGVGGDTTVLVIVGRRHGPQLLGLPPCAGSAAPDGPVLRGRGRLGGGRCRARKEGRGGCGRPPCHSAEPPPVGHPLPAAQRALPAEHEVGQLGDRLGALPGVLHPQLQRGLRPAQSARPGASRPCGPRGGGRSAGPDRGAGRRADGSGQRPLGRRSGSSVWTRSSPAPSAPTCRT